MLSIAGIVLGSALGQPQDTEVRVGVGVIADDAATAIVGVDDRGTLEMGEVGDSLVRIEIESSTDEYQSFLIAFDGVLLQVIDAEPTEPDDLEHTIDVTVAEETDDAEEFLAPSVHSGNVEDRWPAGHTYTFSDDLEFGLDPDHAPQAVGVRFASVAVPRSAEVLEAHLRFTALANPEPGSDGDVDLTISGSRAPETFEGDPNERVGPNPPGFGVTSRERTLSTVAWSIDEVWTDGETYRSSDVSPIVQELIDAPGWSPGNAMVFILEGDPESPEYRRAYAHAGSEGIEERLPGLMVRYRIPVDAASVRAGTTVAIPSGRFVVTVIPYPKQGGLGVAGPPLNFTLVIDGARTPDAPPRSLHPGAVLSPPTEATPFEARPAAIPDGTTVRRLDSGRVVAPDGSHLASVELLSLDDATSVLSLTWSVALAADSRPTLWSGTCADPGAALAELVGGTSPGAGVRLPITGTALRLGRFALLLDDRVGAGSRCGEFAF